MHRLDESDQFGAVVEVGFPARSVRVGGWGRRPAQAGWRPCQSSQSILCPARGSGVASAAAVASIWLLAVSTLQPPRPTDGLPRRASRPVELFADAGAHHGGVVRVQHQQGRLLQQGR
jgi:hypothetical protein